jgi:hypothetical protein
LDKLVKLTEDIEIGVRISAAEALYGLGQTGIEVESLSERKSLII